MPNHPVGHLVIREVKPPDANITQQDIFCSPTELRIVENETFEQCIEAQLIIDRLRDRF